MKELTVKELYTLNETIAKDIFEGVTYPWEVLPKISEFILRLGETLSEDEYDRCKKKWTKYVRNKQFGMKLPEETNSVKYRDALIYTATIKEDQDKLWDNKRIWEALRDKGLQILSGLDVIEYCLKAGEKDKVLECIDSLSGYENNLEEVAKN